MTTKNKAKVRKGYEFRVVWKRKEHRQKDKIYKNPKAMEKFLLLFTDKPWKAFVDDGDKPICCGGNMCGCGGETYSEKYKKNNGLPEVEYMYVEKRSYSFTPWEKQRDIVEYVEPEEKECPF